MLPIGVPTDHTTWESILGMPEIIQAITAELTKDELKELREMSQRSYEQLSSIYFNKVGQSFYILPVRWYAPEWEVFTAPSLRNERRFYGELFYIHRTIWVLNLGFMSPYSGEHGKEILRNFRNTIPHVTRVIIRSVNPASSEIQTFLSSFLEEICIGITKKLELHFICSHFEENMIRNITSKIPLSIQTHFHIDSS